MKKTITSLALAVFMSNGYTGTMGAAVVDSNTYLSVFGGGGSLSSLSLAQLGSAYYTEASGGPLAVNAFGNAPSQSMWMVGGNAGHYFSNIFVPLMSQWSLKPGAEIEGYYIGQNTIHADDINNSTTRLTEHDFAISYPMSTGLGLINAVASFNHNDFAQWHPYVAGGIGVALVSISKANSLQTSPLEAGVNHYNSDASDSDTTLASQVKAGLSFDITEHLGLFGEYRYLYLASTNYTFGSTVYPTHVATSNWNVKLGSQSYNMGVGGVRYVF